LSEIHAAFASQNPITLSRLTELLELLQANLAGPAYDRACELLKAMASPQYSAALHDTDAGPGVVDVPYVGGSGTVGGTLTCTNGNWTGEPTSYAYRWQSDGAAIVGASASSYVVAEGDVGHSLACVVTATNASGSTQAPPSNAVIAAAAATRRT
jgi:hypothetical protein